MVRIHIIYDNEQEAIISWLMATMICSKGKEQLGKTVALDSGQWTVDIGTIFNPGHDSNIPQHSKYLNE